MRVVVEEVRRLVLGEVRCFASFGLSPFSGDGWLRRREWRIEQSGVLRPCLLLEPIGQEVAQLRWRIGLSGGLGLCLLLEPFGQEVVWTLSGLCGELELPLGLGLELVEAGLGPR